MTAHIVDSAFLGDLYGTSAMREVWCDRSRLQRWLDVEAALARAEADCGLIPTEAADEIARRARAEELDLAALGRAIAEATHPIVPVVRAVTKACRGDLGQYIHYGATTQDITDTGLVLHVQAAYPLLMAEVAGAKAELARLAREHRGTHDLRAQGRDLVAAARWLVAAARCHSPAGAHWPVRRGGRYLGIARSDRHRGPTPAVFVA
jgi:hypothetical protein